VGRLIRDEGLYIPAVRFSNGVGKGCVIDTWDGHNVLECDHTHGSSDGDWAINKAMLCARKMLERWKKEGSR